MRSVRVPILAFCLTLIPLGARPADDFDAAAAKALFEARCSLCHSVDRALKKSKDRPGWIKTVSRMRGYASGRITEAEADAIMEYLVRTRGPKS